MKSEWWVYVCTAFKILLHNICLNGKENINKLILHVTVNYLFILFALFECQVIGLYLFGVLAFFFMWCPCYVCEGVHVTFERLDTKKHYIGICNRHNHFLCGRIQGLYLSLLINNVSLSLKLVVVNWKKKKNQVLRPYVDTF